MPGIRVFRRQWLIASDDFVFPGLFELFLRMFWWVGILTLFTDHKGHFDCSGTEVLHAYLTGLLVVLALFILSLCAIVYVSAQGSILNTDKRRCMPVLVYLRAVLCLPELAWACLGTVWLSHNSHGCDTVTVGAVITGVIVSWIILLFTALVVLLVFDPLGDPDPQNRPLRVRKLQSNKFLLFLSKVRSWASKVWEYRLRVLCCCLPHNDRNQAAISSIAETFSKFFSQTYFVPSDIAAGLSLLQQEQEKKEQSRDTETEIDHSPSSPMRDDLELELENAAHWIRFAAAVYGLPKYICSFLFSRPCRLFDDYRNYDVGGDALGCQFASIRKTTGLQSRDFIRVSFHDQVYEVPFFVALDHERKAVVVAIRGTQSLEDVLTDLSFECEDLPIEGVTGACYAHKGMCKTARYIYNKLVNDDDGILYQAFSKVPEYKLVITGHSLGAGTTSIVALLLRKSYPTLQCYSFSPPGGLLSKALADYSKDFVISVVLGKDVVPRLSLPNMEDLKKQIFHTVYNCNKPKYRILLQGLWYELFGGYPGDSPTEMEHNREGALLMYESLESENWLVRTAPDVPLFLPGRILYITEDGPPRRCCSSQVKYRADWSSEMNFKTILISPRMIGDHMTNSVMGALNSLIGETPSPPL